MNWSRLGCTFYYMDFLDMHDVDLLYSYHLKRRILLMTSCKIGIQACWTVCFVKIIIQRIIVINHLIVNAKPPSCRCVPHFRRLKESLHYDSTDYLAAADTSAGVIGSRSRPWSDVNQNYRTIWLGYWLSDIFHSWIFSQKWDWLSLCPTIMWKQTGFK